MGKSKIKIIGIDACTQVSSISKDNFINSSDVLVGGNRHLDSFGGFKGIKLPITHDIPGLIENIRQYMKNDLSISVLASGDPLMFGIGNTLIREFGIDSVEVYPGISSVQAVLSRLGLGTDNVLIINSHAGINDFFDKIPYYDISVVLTSEKVTPADVIRDLKERFPWSSGWTGHICECIGMHDEHIISDRLDKFATFNLFKTPNLLIIQNPDPLSCSQACIFGRPDDEFAHDAGMITHPEIRAVTLSKLKLNNNGVMWDIGAGSGSVGIEAALLAPLLKVCCIEKNMERMERILINREKFNVHNLFPMQGKATEVCPLLPSPDRIFIGGGGDDLYALLSFGFNALREGGIMVINTVTFEAIEAAKSFCMSETRDFDLIQIQVSRQHAFSKYHMFKPDNPVSIFTVKK